MADYVGVKCDQCPAHTSDPQDWLVAIEKPEMDGVLYEAMDALSDDLPPDYIVRHLCCDECARIDFNCWLDRHKFQRWQERESQLNLPGKAQQ